MSIILKNISKIYQGQPVLQNVTIKFDHNSVNILSGESGLGKTTLLNIIAGLLPPDSGTIEGVPPLISYLFQENRLIEDLSALENILLVNKNIPKVILREHLKQLGFQKIDLEKKIEEMSGGMKRRAAIARAILYPSDLLLLDEPFQGIDPKNVQKVIDYVKMYQEKRTIVAVTHDREYGRRLGDFFFELKNFNKF